MKDDWILGSGSPRRLELLTQLGLTFRVIVPDVDELDAEYYDPKELVLINARKKAEKIFETEKRACILTADTTVALGNQIFNKPRDLSHAKSMLACLSGKTHSVFTAVHFFCGDIQWEFVEESRVTFKNFSGGQLDTYLTLINPLDKAGGYAIQDEGSIIVQKYEGSYSNIVGLPLEKLKEKLIKTGFLNSD